MKLRLTSRFIVTLLAVGLLPLLVLAGMILKSNRAIMDDSGQLLMTTAQSTLDIIDRNLFERYGDVQAFATNKVLQQPWSSPAAQAAITDSINTYVKLYGVYSLSMVLDAQGRVFAVNSVDAAGKPLDTSFLLGKDFSQASWFQDAKAGKFTSSESLTGTVVTDVTNDPDVSKIKGPGALAIGYSAPITDARGQFIGVWRNLADFSLVEDIIRFAWNDLQIHGLKSAELVLVNNKGTILAEYDPSGAGKKDFQRDFNNILKLNLADSGVESVKRAIRGESGFGPGYHVRKKINLTSGFAQSKGALGYPGLGWALAIRDPDAELNGLVHASNRLTYTVVGASALLLVGVAFGVARSITRPINACVHAVGQLANGDLTAKVDVRRSDELGELADSVNKCVANLRSMVIDLGATSRALGESSSVLTQTANSQAAGAEETNVQANTVAAAGEELAVNSKSMSQSAGEITRSATTVAAAVEEMSASISEVARNCAHESEIARRADEKARHTRELMGQLDSAAHQIGKIVELINRIAEQTNLLALNATIEAASAGEAGRGFAVVANEVKELARQSAAATDDIRRQVDLIQQNTATSVNAIDEVAGVIGQVSEIASSIAAAVEEQSATTSEIARSLQNVTAATTSLSENVDHAAAGASEVSRNIHGVSEAASDSARGAARITESARELTRHSDRLSEMVGRFRIDADAAPAAAGHNSGGLGHNSGTGVGNSGGDIGSAGRLSKHGVEHLTNAISAHSQWKTRLLDAINTGASTWSPAKTQQDNQCDFGRWLESLDAGIRNQPAWQTIRSLHSDFHKEAASILQSALEGQKARARSQMEDQQSRFNDLSRRLSSALMTMKSQQA